MTNITSPGLHFIMAMSCVVVCYISYWILMHALTRVHEDHLLLERRVLMSRALGFIIMGLLPAILFMTFTSMSLNELGIQFQWSRSIVIWCVAAGIPTVLSAYLGAKNTRYNKENVNNPHGTNTTKSLWDNLTGWAMYLLGYEFLFRGVLLFGSLQIMGPFEAIVLNTALYAFAHLPKGNTETIGAIPFGIVLCLATIQTGSIWTAFFLHYLLAGASTIFSFTLRHKQKLILS